MVAKLSSSSTMSAASLATSLPVMPMATPMWARFSAGASLTPSPVMATMSPRWRRASTILSLCSGDTRANTLTSPTASANSPGGSRSSSAPVRMRSPAAIPSARAMYPAVRGWSPVIMTGRMPAATQVATASRASGRGGSRMPTSPTKVRSFSMLSWLLSSGSVSSRRNPTPSTRIPSRARRSFAPTIRDVHSSSSRSLVWPTHTCREMPTS